MPLFPFINSSSFIKCSCKNFSNEKINSLNFLDFNSKEIQGEAIKIIKETTNNEDKLFLIKFLEPLQLEPRAPLKEEINCPIFYQYI